LARRGRMLIQAPRMLFHIEQGALFSLGVAKIQWMSVVSGPFPWAGSLVWSAWCLINSFQGSPPGARPLTRSFARKASDCDLGSIMPSPPLAMGRVRVSHFTLARVGATFPPPNKVPYDFAHLAAHAGIKVPACGQVPSRGQ
jgi:hypothetical protein